MDAWIIRTIFQIPCLLAICLVFSKYFLRRFFILKTILGDVMKKVFLIGMLVVWITSPLLAERTKVAQVGMQFLKLGIGARATAMGEAATVSLNDLSTLFWNPGALALSEASGAAAYQTEWICGIKEYAFAGAFQRNPYGALGLTFIYMDYPTLTATRPPQRWEIGQPPQILGEFDVAEFAIGLTYSRQVTNHLSLGGQIKYVYQDLGSSDVILNYTLDTNGDQIGAETRSVDNNLGALGFDFGTVYHTGFKSLRFGMVVQHFSRDMQYESQPEYTHDRFSMPLIFKLGMAMEVSDFFPSWKNIHQLTLATDLLHPRDYTERVHVGLEYWFQGLLALRGGYKFNYDSESFTGGIGLRFRVSTLQAYLDYSIADFGEYFDNISRLDFGFQF